MQKTKVVNLVLRYGDILFCVLCELWSALKIPAFSVFFPAVIMKFKIQGHYQNKCARSVLLHRYFLFFLF